MAWPRASRAGSSDRPPRAATAPNAPTVPITRPDASMPDSEANNDAVKASAAEPDPAPGNGVGVGVTCGASTRTVKGVADHRPSSSCARTLTTTLSPGSAYTCDAVVAAPGSWLVLPSPQSMNQLLTVSAPASV